MVAVTLPVQQAWTGLQARRARHQPGRGNTQLGLRPPHRGKCQREGGEADPVRNLSKRVTCSAVLRVSFVFHQSIWGVWLSSPSWNLTSSPLQSRGGSEFHLGGRRFTDSSHHLFFSSLAQMSPGPPAQAQHKGCGGGPP